MVEQEKSGARGRGSAAEGPETDGRARGAGEDGESRPPGGDPGTSPWECVIGAIGLLLVLGAVGFLGYEGLTASQEPPRIAIAGRSAIPQPGGFLLEVEVRNLGGATIAGLTVEGEQTGPDGSPETSEMSLDFVPGRSTQRGGLFFTRDPSRFPPVLRAKGFQEP